MTDAEQTIELKKINLRDSIEDAKAQIEGLKLSSGVMASKIIECLEADLEVTKKALLAMEANQGMDARAIQLMGSAQIGVVGTDIPFEGSENFVDAYTQLVSNGSVLVDQDLFTRITEYYANGSVALENFNIVSFANGEEGFLVIGK